MQSCIKNAGNKTPNLMIFLLGFTSTVFWGLSQRCSASVNDTVVFPIIIIFKCLFLIALELQMKSALKACNCHAITTYGNFKMAMPADGCNCSFL